MYFQESEAIALEHPELVQVVEEIDGHLASIFTHAPLRPGDFACVISCDENQVVAVFDLLADREVLNADRSVECRQCQNLMPHVDFQQAVEDEDDFECTSCGRPFHRHTPVTMVYRLSAETLARPKPAVKTDDVESALRHLDGRQHVFQRMGQVWVLKYDGKMVLMEDARGMTYLARLLVDPQQVVPAASLLASVAGIDPRIATGSSGRLLDDEAFANYRTRYLELQEEIEEAREMNDHARIAELESEQEAFEIEIAKATGLGGKKREKTDADRVRRNVSMAVTRAIDSIRDEHQVLGRHLRNSISSGLSFCYDPERDPGWLA